MAQTEPKSTDLLSRRHVCHACPALIDKALLVSDGKSSRRLLRISLVNTSQDMTLTGASFQVIYHLKKTRSYSPEPVSLRVRFPDFVCRPGEGTACRIAVPELEGKLECYEILIDRVKTEDGYELEFTDEDYESVEAEHKNKFTAAIARWYADKKLFTLSVVAFTLLVVCGIAIAVILGKIVGTMPISDKTSSYADYIAEHDYDAAIALAMRNKDDGRVSSLRGDAAVYWFSQGEVSRALAYAASCAEFDYNDFYAQIFTDFSARGDFQGGLEFALLHEPTETEATDTTQTSNEATEAAETTSSAYGTAFNSFLTDAVFKYITDGDTAEALRYASYAAHTDTETGDTQITTMLNDAITERVDADKWDDAYNFAALIQSNYPSAAKFSPEDIAAKAVDHYIYTRDFEKALYFADQITDDTAYRKNALTYAVVYYTSEAGLDYDTAIAYAEKLGDAAILSSTLTAAVNYCIEKWHDRAEGENGLEMLEAAEAYARRASGTTAAKLSVAVMNVRALIYYEAGDGSFDLLLKCLDDIAASDSGSSDAFFAAVPKDYVRTHIEKLYSRMSAQAKRTYNARTFDAFKYAVGISANDTPVCGTPLNWEKLVSVSVSEHSILGLTSGGSVLAYSDNLSGEGDVGGWVGIVDIAAGIEHSAGLMSSGMVTAAGSNAYGQCDVSGWSGIVSIAAGSSHTVGLRTDGTVTAAGLNASGQCDVSEWTNVVAIEAGTYHTLGLRSDGTVYAAGDNSDGKCEVAGWSNITAIAAGDCVSVGLRADGTVVMTGKPVYGSAGDCSAWTDIVDVAAGSVAVYGLKRDGTVVSTGDGACDASIFKDVRTAQ